MQRMRRNSGMFFAVIAAITCAAAEVGRFEPAIAKFEAEDAKSPPPKGAVLFVGSSSIRLWKTAEAFPDIETINRGFGGSQIADSTLYADRIVIPYAPRTIVFYAGDNDIAAGLTPDQLASDYQKFVNKVHSALPDCRIVFVGIKPSIARWQLVDKVRAANELIRAYSAGHDYLAYLDVDAPMLGADAKPRPELFVEDGLHLSEAGYDLWESLLLPLLANP